MTTPDNDIRNKRLLQNHLRSNGKPAAPLGFPNRPQPGLQYPGRKATDPPPRPVDTSARLSNAEQRERLDTILAQKKESSRAAILLKANTNARTIASKLSDPWSLSRRFSTSLD